MYDQLAKSHPRIEAGICFCRDCGSWKKVNPSNALRNGWPKCCSYTMTIDPPDKWKGLALQLVLTREWFEAIRDGDKREEYRTISEYWWKRIFNTPWRETNRFDGMYKERFPFVRFRLGYAKDAPTMVWQVGFCGLYEPNPEWCPPGTPKSIVIQLNKRVA